jgi:Smg protein
MNSKPVHERVLAIVSLIAQYVLDQNDIPADGDIVEELLSVGFKEEEIDAAFSWMENVSLPNRGPASLGDVHPTNRVFSGDEVRILSADARGFLTQLRNLGILDDIVLEEIIDKAVHGYDDDITLKDLKTLTILTLFAHAHYDWLREVDCIMEDDWSRLYH